MMNCLKLKYFLFLLFLSCHGLPALAQREGIKNLPYIDHRRVHYGFALGITMIDVNFQHTGHLADDGAVWYVESPALNPSFCVGLLGDLAFTEHLNLRSCPMFYFQTREITFRNNTVGNTHKQSLKTSYLEVPVSLKYSARRLNNYRPYMMCGASVFYDFTHEKEKPIVFNHWDLGLHIGLGCDFYLPFFKLVPELRFNIGLVDMLDHDRNNLKDQTMKQYTDALSSARNKSVSLIFYFE